MSYPFSETFKTNIHSFSKKITNRHKVNQKAIIIYIFNLLDYFTAIHYSKIL